ncbi:hypothetical protein BJF78_30180 [Pseudonocardia sp. CNS-139]|nr:hypothetical protein BJF78_30180 [Pseudonocardia sp. CNS-139]
MFPTVELLVLASMTITSGVIVGIALVLYVRATRNPRRRMVLIVRTGWILLAAFILAAGTLTYILIVAPLRGVVLSPFVGWTLIIGAVIAFVYLLLWIVLTVYVRHTQSSRLAPGEPMWSPDPRAYI